MTGRRAFQVGLFVAIVVGIAALSFLRSGKTPPSQPRRAASATPVAVDPANSSGAVAVPVVAQPAAEAPLEGESQIADELNAPGGTIQRDLSILEEVFATWLTNFPRLGNPVGENAEITAALTGGNSVRFAFVPRRHRAINSAGELCDRWGTPFRFHQLSGTQMEIRSAGPDRKFATADDAVLGPSP